MTDRREEAARWFTVLDRGLMTHEERASYDLWHQDPANAAAIGELQRIWADLDVKAVDALQGRQSEPSLERRKFIRRAAGLALIVGAGSLAGPRFYHSLRQKEADLSSDTILQTAIGEQRSVQLTDGSILNLNVASRVKYRFDTALRMAELQNGQAEFIIAKDTQRPFMVYARQRTLRTLNAIFDVKTGIGWAEVGVREGTVELSNTTQTIDGNWSGEAIVLQPGEKVTYRGPELAPVHQVAIETIGQWRDRILSFESTPLKDVAQELNLYFSGRIFVEDPQLGDERVTLRLQVLERDKTLDAIAKLLSLKIEHRNNDAVISRDRRI